MKTLLLPLAFLLLLPACKKPDNTPATNSPAPVTAKIKTITTEPLEGPQVGHTTRYRFTYEPAGRVDTMQLFGDGVLATTTVSKYYPSYTIRRNYLSEAFTSDYMADSLTLSPDGQITGRYLYVIDTNSGLQAGVLLQTLFSYNANQQLTSWTTTLLNVSPTVSATHTVNWNSGNAVAVSGEDLAYNARVIAGNYTYDPTKAGQPAHPLSVFALTQWGEPRLRCVHHAMSQTIPGMQLLQNITWSQGLIQTYDTYEANLQKVRVTFTYY